MTPDEKLSNRNTVTGIGMWTLFKFRTHLITIF